jgi:hypothetical protein
MMSGYSKPAPSDAELLHGAGQAGAVLHPSNRHADITSSTRKGSDPGMSATLGRPRAASDMSGSSPEDHVVAPGQRTVTAPKGAPTPSKMY